ncbi:keratin-associated protein 5-3-like isoform X2 [Hyla sarda]|nr:keratin-associated protein 5-3-like isoform X2 [Hyla sarda]XP_056402414.1 keratin-associated protein 5-3-like isoform X2 [Hyla sarda]XP_056402415.1 keratin-associated protein 5-3-like isoform X2 [Hyla sarda]XP_056402416.1 keratin-associated protein 5-3-like isoform X2 [Hyla sarda]XP_056402417.1 keratin-associated protein 5-3-like isoform X2 [Hyla sarda]XP_056402418.1 keratin-associated protein 5-3-like isoform X2 [Hyla sarda]
MPSPGCLLLCSLILALLSPASGYYLRRPRCPAAVSRTNCQSVPVSPCMRNTDCLGSQSCCDIGCGLHCFSVDRFLDGLPNFFSNFFCAGCGRGCSGGGCGGRCSRCGQNGGYGGGYGGCPAVPANNRCPVSRNRCSFDLDCGGGGRCCNNGCNNVCTRNLAGLSSVFSIFYDPFSYAAFGPFRNSFWFG